MAIFYSVLLPENMHIILVEVNKACNFDFYSTENLDNEAFQFGDTPSFSDQFEVAGI
eukprot:CAMPEP_0170450710 /NCGR_PEP_ID=MMETSP0123-20130129/160_1 /TAXON_ID=182087 /ORGANISM="Favella ehrenbergii, Strain Fehren 1" /LENGTH=56 /DNA_ID=CAMNT_0010712091 /DNA_START=1796 /DNA_END=1966 /DNA_ORIENTATION=-